MGVIDYSIRRRVAALEARISGGNVVDLGVLHATDLIHGAQTLYTPSGTDYVAITLGPADFQQLDHQAVYVRPEATSLFIFNCATSAASAADVAIAPGRVYSTEPIYAVLETDVSSIDVEDPPPAWASTHVYAATFLILGPDSHYWSSGAGGTSAGSIPDFAGNEGGTVTDGSVTWTDEGHVPTAGALHLYAIVTPLG